MRLEKAGVLEKLISSDWATPIEVVSRKMAMSDSVGLTLNLQWMLTSTPCFFLRIYFAGPGQSHLLY